MINFRYHLVSLIAVFLALAVGVVLGAGPLKEAIGDTLTGEVDQLRTESEQLRTDLVAGETALTEANGFISAVAPHLVSGSLTDRRIALVTLAPADPAVVAAVAEQLAAAGATISAQVDLTPAWTDPAKATFRQQFAGSIAAYLDPVPPVGSGESVDLADGLIQALTKTDPNDPNTLRPGYDLLIELLVNGELVTVSTAPTQPVDVVVIVAPAAPAVAADSATPSASADPGGATGADEAAATGAYLALATVAGSQVPTVLVSPTTTSPVIAAVKADPAAGAAVTTVSNVASVPGVVSVPLAVTVDASGSVGHYGPGEGEEPAPPRVELPAPQRVPSVSSVPPAEPAAPAEPVEPAPQG